ncbi:MAG: prolipoprotein diacylglyceryl transferase [Clostridia bacterium]|nr:prolipoprotein diacylglyceryl transferase [Clostridia bacterium]
MNTLIMSIPKGFSLFGLQINFYGLISALSYLLGILLTVKNAKKRGFKTEDIVTLACYVIPAAIIGARLYYVLFRLDHYTNFWDFFKIWEGGLGFYGGLIGGAIAVMLYCIIHKKNFLALLDIIAPSLICAQALGRWGNFFNQEAYGYYNDNPSTQWFPFSVYIDHCSQVDCTCPGFGWHLATFFYESFGNFLTFAVLMLFLYKCDFKQNGIIACFYLILYGIERMLIEGLRTDSLYLGSIRISQLLSAIFVIAGIGLLLYALHLNRKKKQDDNSFSKIMKILKTDL